MKSAFKEVYSFDKKCYEEYKLTEDILMEHAAYTMALEIYKRVPKNSIVNIVAGPGNNGADGVTLARILLGDYHINLYMPLGAKSQMCKIQLQRYKAVGGVVENEYKNCDVLVDAVFGSGLKRDLSEEIVKIVNKMNHLNALKIACDIPTGIDDNGNLRPVAFRADLTVTMGAEKIALYSDSAKDYVGEIIVADLGVSFTKYINRCCYFVLEKEDLITPLRSKQNSHKRTYGHLGVLVGDKPGAGILAAESAFNYGCGLVSIVESPECEVRSPVPYEIMKTENFEHFTALSFGMGLGCCFDEKMDDLLKLDIPMVIDADMFYKKEIVKFLDKKAVLTPHPKEFVSLLNLTGLGQYSVKEVQQKRFELVEKFSEKYPNVVLVLKGANKIIAYNKKLFIDPNGSVALAKGGSGDVLSGIIGSLLAQGWHPLKAAIHGSLAHSLAGHYEPNFALTPTKIIQNLEKLI